MLPVSRESLRKRTTELMLTPHCSAASAMVAPPSIASTTRLRKSSEYGFAIHAGLLPVASLNHIRARMGIPDSAFSGNALVLADRPSSGGQQALDVVDHELGLIRLCQRRSLSAQIGRGAGGARNRAGQYDLQLRPIIANPPRQAEPVHRAGHLDVAEDDID